jgi:hypothetical protein
MMPDMRLACSNGFHTRRRTTKYVGVDLHKKVISLCVVMQKAGQRVVVKRETLCCDEPQRIQSWFRRLGAFQVTVEATSSYEWFVQLVKPLADRVVLAHPKKLRVIAESTRKTDKLDAQVLAEFLSLGRGKVKGTGINYSANDSRSFLIPPLQLDEGPPNRQLTVILWRGMVINN